MRAGVGRRRADVGGLDLDPDEVKRDAAGLKCEAGEDELCAASHEYDPGERECSAVGLEPVSDGVGDLPGGHKWRSGKLDLLSAESKHVPAGYERSPDNSKCLPDGAHHLAGELEHIADASEPFTGALKRASA